MARPAFGTIAFIRRGPLAPHYDQMALGQSDPPLAPGFEAAEAELLQVLAPLRARKILGSDLLRSRETASRLADALRIDLSIRKDLRPQRLGSLQGKVWAELIAEDPGPVLAFLNDFTSAAPPRGEAMPVLADRVSRALLAEVRRHPRQLLVHVGHAAVIRAFCAECLGLSLAAVQRWQLDPFGLSVLRLEGQQATLVLWNQRTATTNVTDLPT